jgi:hypothetical protein
MVQALVMGEQPRSQTPGCPVAGAAKRFLLARDRFLDGACRRGSARDSAHDPGDFHRDPRVHMQCEAENYDQNAAEDEHRGRRRLAKMRPAR